MLTSFRDLEEIVASVTKTTLVSASNTPIILIDGRSGSGKSTLGKELQNRLFVEGESLPRLLSMDSLYPGWDGLEEGVQYLQRMVLTPLQKSSTATWQEYDWEAGTRKQWREFSGSTPLIIEGCGSISPVSAALAEAVIWLDVPELVRYQRWIERDGDRFMDYWSIWASQEEEYISRVKPEQFVTHRYDYEAKL